MASKLSRIVFYTIIAILAYAIIYIQLAYSLSPNPDLQLVKIVSGITGVVVSLVTYFVLRWTRKKVKKGSEWAKDMGDKGREKLEEMRS